MVGDNVSLSRGALGTYVEANLRAGPSVARPIHCTGSHMSDQNAQSPRRSPHPLIALAGLTAGLGAILVALLALFILPSLKSGPHDLPLGVVGTPDAIAAIEQNLDQLMPGAFDIRAFPTQQALDDAIGGRAVVGGYVSEDTTLQARLASAGSTAISGTVATTASALAQAMNMSLEVTDITPLPAADPAGIGIGGLTFPLVFGGIVPVVAFKSVFPRSNGWRLAGIGLTAVASGVIVAAVLQFWFGSIEDAFWPVAAAMALGIAGMAMPLAGLQHVFGGKGFTIGAMVMMFLGNPLAGIATTAAWLPNGLGLFGQILPPGATGTLVRSAAYFDWAGGGVAAMTLVAWVLVGTVLTGIGIARERAMQLPASA